MHYLVCRKCKGYYKLQKGESIEDFGGCECGGTLKHAVFGALENESFEAEETLKPEGFIAQIEDLLVKFPTASKTSFLTVFVVSNHRFDNIRKFSIFASPKIPRIFGVQNFQFY
jgi:hypothetical protein